MIDMDKLMGFCDGDPELAMSFLEMFRMEAKLALTEMPDLHAAGKMEALSNTAHKLKSHCRYVGADNAADLAQEIESLADNGNMAGLDQKLPKLYTVIDSVINSF